MVVKNIDNNKYKIVLIKTIDNIVPVYYRIVNLATYEIEDIPAHRILDEIINKKIEIINIKVENGQIITLNEDGYESTEDVILVDEFDTEVMDLFEFSIRRKTQHLDGNDRSLSMMTYFDVSKNGFAPSNFKINSKDKIYWTCKKGHTIRCGFPTFYSLHCECPICKMEENEETPSLNYWAHITDHLDILKYYEDADENLASSKDIGWKEKKKVYFNKAGETVRNFLSSVTSKNKPIGFKDEKQAEQINLTHPTEKSKQTAKRKEQTNKKEQAKKIDDKMPKITYRKVATKAVKTSTKGVKQK